MDDLLTVLDSPDLIPTRTGMCQRRGTGPEIAVRKCTLGNPDLPRLIRRTRRQHGRPFNQDLLKARAYLDKAIDLEHERRS